MGLPQWLSGTESACNAGDVGLIPVQEDSPGEGNGNPTHSSILAWEITWTGEPGRPCGRRVGHKLATKQHYTILKIMIKLMLII